MTNKKIWAATLFSTLLLTMTISSPVKAAELQTSTTVDRSQITLPLSEETEENLFSLESVSDIQMSELVDPDEVISVSDGDDTIQARKGTATKYGWSYGTTPYTFTQKWSTDTEVYSTYPYYNDGLLYPAATELLDAPSNSQYSSAVREGYVNDTWATEQSIVGAHVYYHKVSSNKALNSVTVLLDKNVAFQIYDAELNPVLDTSLKIIQKLTKQGKDAAEIYVQQGRQDLADAELAQVKVMEAYLPKQMTPEELEAALKAIIAEVGATSGKDMGKVMGVASKKLAGLAEGRAISAKVKELLG